MAHHQGQEKSVKSKCKRQEESNVNKKFKMRTATDVISRLLWDESLPKDDFVVGYLDRFVGVMEKPFTFLDWSDPAIVDNYTLALPKHRIQYFKYKNERVWDKMRKIDIIFGSTDSTTNIYDFMKEVDKKESYFIEEEQQEMDEIAWLHENDTNYAQNYVENDVRSEHSEESAKVLDMSEIYPENKDRSNFFIAVRMTDSDLLKNLGKFAESIKEREPSLSECCMTEAEYHMTLLTLRLDSIDEIAEACNALKNFKPRSTSLPKIQLHSLNTFRFRVLYSVVECDELLYNLREDLINTLSKHNISAKDKFYFVPHVTVMKLSRPTVRSRHSKFIDAYLYAAHEDAYFGSQVVDKLYLCGMGAERREDGFYKCALELDLS